jgi:hypothetical protein
MIYVTYTIYVKISFNSLTEEKNIHEEKYLPYYLDEFKFKLYQLCVIVVFR